MPRPNCERRRGRRPMQLARLQRAQRQPWGRTATRICCGRSISAGRWRGSTRRQGRRDRIAGRGGNADRERPRTACRNSASGPAMSRTNTRSTSSSCGCSWSRDGQPTPSRPPSDCGREAMSSRLAGGRSFAPSATPTDVTGDASCASASVTCSARSPRGGSRARPANRQQALATFSQELAASPSRTYQAFLDDRSGALRRRGDARGAAEALRASRRRLAG